ncbi:YncE family protein [Ancylobacter sp. 6x-1]|uniref:YncE family protein n=1 Tax=Ancylobacter crimeensis TaxID=2579147 RepID=A0ABT0DBA0_9HYPH|nr:YncE family protein [Ancylobacter crimeensis]MCK0197227.1 YncE family protein [Ancylobacter crimeensis]
MSLALLAPRLSLRAGLLATAAFLLMPAYAEAEPQVVKSVKPADGLYEVVVGNDRVYVAATGPRGSDQGKILALDPKTLEVKETIALGDDPVFGLGINTKTKTLYGTQTRDGVLAIIDLATGKVVGTVKKGEKSHVREVLVDEDADRAYVSIFTRGETAGEVWVVDGAKKELAGTITDLPAGVSGLALDPKGKRLFVITMLNNEVHIVDLASGKVVKDMPTGGKGSINVAYDPNGNRLFIANQESNDLTVLNADDGTVLATIPTGEGALGVAYDPARNLAFVANRRGGYVSIVDGKELKVVANVVTGSMPNTVAIDKAGGGIFVTNKVKTGMRPPRPAEGPAPAGAPPAGAPGATAAAPAGAAPAGAPPAGGPGGPGGRPAPMIDPYGDTVTLVTP